MGNPTENIPLVNNKAQPPAQLVNNLGYKVPCKRRGRPVTNVSKCDRCGTQK